MKTENPADRRQFGRRQTSLHAWIAVSGRPRLPCVVRNISIGGALLELETPPWLPYNFRLTIEATRFITMCEVRHTSSHSIGVRFMSATEAAALEKPTGVNVGLLDEKDAWMGDRR